MGPKSVCDTEECAAWFAGRIPDEWFLGPVSVMADRDEILVTGELPLPESVPEGEDALRVAVNSRIDGFREDTRLERMKIAEVGQARWSRHVSWLVTCGDIQASFTTAAVPVMTRLRFDQRQVLDTLIESGVAHSRSEALGWCVRQVEENQGEWMGRLKEALAEVERVRAEGP